MFKGSEEDVVEDAESTINVDATEAETQDCVDWNIDCSRQRELESECSGKDASAESETEYQVSNEVSCTRECFNTLGLYT